MKILNNNKFFYFLIAIEIFISSILNYNANLMSGIVPLYIDFSNFFKSNFNFNYIFQNNYYTFPMWGYGFFLILFKSKISIIIFQQLITFFIILALDQKFIKEKLLVKHYILRILLLLSVHWFFFQTSIWPYSLSANLLILSILLITSYLKFRKLYLLIFSAICFGIMLNLRSDYYYLQFIIILLLVLTGGFRKNQLFSALLFAIIVNILLIPWGLYTLKRTNHYLQTSTNAGHVFYISLGQLPNNIWKITPKDEDSSMKYLLQQKFKTSSVNSLSYESNIFLMNTWVNLVKNNPIEYLKKCIFNIVRLTTTPFYPGSIEKNFSKNSNFEEIKVKAKELFNTTSYFKLSKFLTIGSGNIFVLAFIFNLLGVFIFLSFILLNVLLMNKGFYYNLYKSPIFLFSNIIILYQIILNVLVFHMPIYNTNVILLYLISISTILDSAIQNKNLIISRFYYKSISKNNNV